MIPNSVTSIGDCAFAGCSGLTMMVIPNGVKSIGKQVFYLCKGLKKSAYPSHLENPFENGISVAYPTDGIIESDGSIFSADKKVLCFVPMDVAEYKIPKNVTDIGDYTFFGCKYLVGIEIPNSVTKVGYGAFELCSSLKSVEIPVGVILIEGSVFAECASLESVAIPNGVKSIGNIAFVRCVNLKSIDIPNSVTSIGIGAFSECNGLTSIDIPSSVTSIGSFAFLKSVNLTRVTMPNSITDIIGDVFSGCTSLASIDIPGSVKKIGDYAFRNCSSLRSIYAYAAEPPMCGKFTFEGVDKDLCKLYVLEESIPAYSTADEWKDFQTILLGVDTVSADGLNVVAVDGMIFIGGVADDAVVEVYSMGGALVYRGSGKSVAVPQAGVYIVSVAGSAVKVMAK